MLFSPAKIILENGEKKNSAPSDAGASTKYPSSERRNGPFTSFSGRDRPDNRGRSGARGGRNGSHTYHSSTHQYSNGQTQGPYSATSFNMPRSSTGFHQDSHFSHQPQHSRVFRGGPSRTQS